MKLIRVEHLFSKHPNWCNPKVLRRVFSHSSWPMIVGTQTAVVHGSYGVLDASSGNWVPHFNTSSISRSPLQSRGIFTR